ncbi:2-isopropylmalate synthase [Caldimonas thermodepolymerans]|jgi:2-isopropylmalate synthase|uniref:2-isopropylmalate synthase n=1 Tax=Caldimonas thermodepolymerans TaxID=215580 RepID=A0AA46DEQ7_9BURK|nr:2-isopropylmalate synthase [Caldimonas thermodepolymerans]TCP07499.1 2-isopropylmalate synthase [Caldimonas thermodepolymerans]UZG44005.1 2-isopropylmalate synthase [Caldimonas thermodepolymerans]UZG47672.1 2-isopropylmalate synthase [Caldimonas thermodepolymerans]
MLKDPSRKYRAFPPVGLKDRTWPDRVITRPPVWMSTDLRDGNQALFEPMNVATKMRLFETIVRVGVKEIEVGFPSASQIDYDFVRKLIEEDRIPEDVTIEVLTQAREDLIARTFESLRGARRAIVHMYNATAPAFRRIVFNMTPDQVRELAVRNARLIKEHAARQPETEWVFQYSPEVFSGTELPVAKDVVDAVMDVWQPTPERKAIVNLPATVEMSTPNIYADQVEWMHRHLKRRDSIVLSVHPHNDRGTAVAAAELAVMAGADRVEGCLFGNGERTGNVDLVTLALNLYSQGVHPGLDFSDINAVARTVEECTQLPIHPRHPYVGDLVFTAFSGSHQDAIRKGMAAQRADAYWEVPYLPIDPADVGRTYDSIVRVNSQSGKGGIAFLLETGYGLVMPRRLQVEFSAAVQRVADATGTELSAQALWELFSEEYLVPREPLRYVAHDSRERDGHVDVQLTVELRGQRMQLHGRGNGPLDAAAQALGLPVRIDSYEERGLQGGSDASAVAFVELAWPGEAGSAYGVGVHTSILSASILALVSGVNRWHARAPQVVDAAFAAWTQRPAAA